MYLDVLLHCCQDRKELQKQHGTESLMKQISNVRNVNCVEKNMTNFTKRKISVTVLMQLETGV